MVGRKEVVLVWWLDKVVVWRKRRRRRRKKRWRKGEGSLTKGEVRGKEEREGRIHAPTSLLVINASPIKR